MNRRKSSLASSIPLVIVLTLAVFAIQTVQAQTYQVLHNFTGGSDGAGPFAGLTIDQAGNLYGTTSGYDEQVATVFKLKHARADWVFNLLYSSDEVFPSARVIFGPDGSLYGTGVTTFSGGAVFNLKPPATPCKNALCGWTETTLYSFSGGSDGEYPSSEVVFDQAGNMYGTTYSGGVGSQRCNGSCGVVYKLTPSSGGWIESVIYSFSGGSDGANPYAGVVFDKRGNLYGTTTYGGMYSCGDLNCGTVFQLTPSRSGWTESALHSFQHSDGAVPYGGLIFDQSGNLYGTTTGGGAGGGGTVFELTPSNGNWVLTTLYSFSGGDGNGPVGSLVMDAGGSLYGTTIGDGAYLSGSVFKLTHSNSGWTYTSLHDFTTCLSDGDGCFPRGNVIFDTSGNLYGTASLGGAYGWGVVWEITP
jgi:uncharacterized repeat protein (TIGR03803 family)